MFLSFKLVLLVMHLSRLLTLLVIVARQVHVSVRTYVQVQLILLRITHSSSAAKPRIHDEMNQHQHP